MRLPIIRTIFRKEITEFLRDRVTFFTVVALPLLLYPLGMLLLGPLAEVAITAHQAPATVSTIAVWGTGAESLIHWLEATNKFYKLEPGKGLPESLRREIEAGRLESVEQFKRTPRELPFALEFSEIIPPGPGDLDSPLLQAVRKVLNLGLADAVLVVWPGFDEALERQESGRATVYFDSVLPQSVSASSRVSTDLETFRKHLVQERQRERGLPAGFSVALSASKEDAAPLKRQIGNIMGRALPLLIIGLTLFGAIAAAADMTAGEKERGTMQTLLCAPVEPLEIMTGKFLAIWSISLVVALANLTGIGFTILRLTSLFGGKVAPFGTLFAMFALLIPAGCVISAIFLAIAALARDAKEAGVFLGIALLSMFAPMALVMLPGMELTVPTSLIPLGNLALLIRAFMMGGATPGLAALTLLSSVAYAVLSLLFAARVFGREQILLSGSISWRWLLRGDAPRPATPTPGLVLVVFALVMAGLFYVGLGLLGQSRAAQVLVPQVLLFLLAVALSIARRFPLAQTFSLRCPRWRSLVGSILIGLTAGAAVEGLTPRFAQMPDWLTHELLKLLVPGDQPGPLWKLWLLIALTPALCEETFFRGLVLSGLRRWGPWAAIGISALLFGLLHGSIYRLLPTFTLGLVLGYAVWRSGSLYCGILVHALNNGLFATLVWSNGGKDLDSKSVPWNLALGALAITGIGMALLTGPKSRPAATSPGAGRSGDGAET